MEQSLNVVRTGCLRYEAFLLVKRVDVRAAVRPCCQTLAACVQPAPEVFGPLSGSLCLHREGSAETSLLPDSPLEAAMKRTPHLHRSDEDDDEGSNSPSSEVPVPREGAKKHERLKFIHYQLDLIIRADEPVLDGPASQVTASGMEAVAPLQKLGGLKIRIVQDDSLLAEVVDRWIVVNCL